MEGSGTQELTAADLRGAARAVAVRPSLWVTALRQLLRLARPGWWRHWPPVPAPDADYAHFRLVTQYGGDGGAPTADDVVQYLKWCRDESRL